MYAACTALLSHVCGHKVWQRKRLLEQIKAARIEKVWNAGGTQVLLQIGMRNGKPSYHPEEPRSRLCVTVIV